MLQNPEHFSFFPFHTFLTPTFDDTFYPFLWFFGLELGHFKHFSNLFSRFRDRDSFDLIQSKFLLYQYSLYTTLSFVKIHKICLIIMFFRCFVSERLINYLIIINLLNFTYQYCLCPIQLLHTWFCQNPRNLFQLANKSRWCEHPIQSHFPNGLWQNRSTHFLHWKQGAL